MFVADLVRAMETIAPTRLAEAWDNVGLLVGDESAPLGRVLLTIDCTRAVVDEAARGRWDAIVAYHPPIFEPTKRFVAGSIAYECARAGIAVYSPHTAFDVAPGGTNDVLAEAIGMAAARPLRPAAGDAAAVGIGRVGDIEPAPIGAVTERVKVALGLSHVLLAGPHDRVVSRAATCAGSGGDLIADAVAAGAEVLLTGEVRHHDALRATALGLSIVATRHSTSERCALPALERRLAALLPGVAIGRSAADRDPFVFA
ncbi:MAG: Nif3-like dinuclear metal center hexameric protein [Polyangiaceae bacterium]|nr:Nif3-like dinuclear metal center hexameric protein [Polyangiaceae bacterium]